MKPTIFIAAVLLSSTAVQAQTTDLKAKSALLNDGSRVTYSYLADNKSVKHGVYSVQRDDNVWVRGNYHDNNRAGNWYFYNANNQLFLTYNYDDAKLLFVDKSSLTDVSIKVFGETTSEAENASVPLPLCSLDEYKLLLADIAKKSIIESTGAVWRKELPVTINAHIDANGKASYNVAYLLNQKTVITDLKVSDKDFKLDWIAAKYNGKALASDFSVDVDLMYEVLEPNAQPYWERQRIPSVLPTPILGIAVSTPDVNYSNKTRVLNSVN